MYIEIGRGDFMNISTENYVDKAEEVIKSLGHPGRRISTSQIRNILKISQQIYENAKRQTGDLTKEEIAEVQILRTRLVYDSGREQKVKIFVEKARLLENIKSIGNSRQNLLLFCRYLESLVAYHRFYGGRD